MSKEASEMRTEVLRDEQPAGLRDASVVIDQLATVRDSIARSLTRGDVAPRACPDTIFDGVAPEPRDVVPHGLAEIALASRALRRVEPTLSNWSSPVTEVPHSPRDVYALIALIWTSITLVIGGSIATVLWLSA